MYDAPTGEITTAQKRSTKNRVYLCMVYLPMFRSAHPTKNRPIQMGIIASTKALPVVMLMKSVIAVADPATMIPNNREN